MASYPVKYFSSRRSGGAPSLSGSTGSLAALLRACLTTGFNNKVPTSITASGNTVTINCTAHGFALYDIIKLSGCNEAVFNGEWRVSAIVSADALQFESDVAVPPSATGTFALRYADLGWTETFTNGTTKSVFRSNDITGSRYSLRLLDDGSYAPTRAGGFRCAQACMVETAYSLDTYDRLKWVQWQKSSSADTTARHWFVVGDGKRFYVGIEWSATYPNVNYVYFFGDILSYRAADVHQAMVVGMSAAYGADTDDPGTATYNTYESAYYLDVGMGADFTFNKTTGMYLGRGYHQFGSFVDAMTIINGGANRLRLLSASQYWGPPGSSFVPYPNPVDNSVIVTGPMFVQENSNLAIRGAMPGLLTPLQNVKPYNDLFPKVNVNGSLRNLHIAQMAAMTLNLSVRGQLAFDTTGPWE